MEILIALVNKIQRACTALGDYGEGSSLPTLWDSLPSSVVRFGLLTAQLHHTSYFPCKSGSCYI
ncbi:unnamed protein product [Arabidopsis lyrata]|nr:unnamed protein product [Arabidopsis lyrata]